MTLKEVLDLVDHEVWVCVRAHDAAGKTRNLALWSADWIGGGIKDPGMPDGLADVLEWDADDLSVERHFTPDGPEMRIVVHAYQPVRCGGVGMTAYAIAMAEVRENSVLCGSDVCLDWDDAVDAADDFMLRCVCDFYEIDDRSWGRAKLGTFAKRKTSVFEGKQKLECSFRDPERTFVVTTSVQETELR